MNDAFLSNDDKEKQEVLLNQKKEYSGSQITTWVIKSDGDEDTYFHMFIQGAENIEGKSNELVVRNYLPISGVAKSLLGITGEAIN